MGATKIINVLKSDNFEEVFEEFKKAQAEEVILILPKNSKVAREPHFAALASEAQSSQKNVTIMTADESAKSFALKYGFKLLADQPDADVESSADLEIIPAEVDKNEEGEIPEELSETEEIEQQENAGIAVPKAEDEEEDYHPDADTGEDISEDLIEEKRDDSLADLAMAKSNLAAAKYAKGKRPASKSKLEKLENIWLARGKAENRSAREKSFWSNINLMPKGKTHNKISWIFSITGIVLLGIIFYFFLGSAKIVIKPQREKIDSQINVSVSSGYFKIDATANKIPGQFLSSSAQATKDFISSGQKEVARKARGEITVFNNFNSEPQGLVATTRFESSNGLIFRTPRPISIPGAKLIDGKLVPGSVVVEVLADKPGQEYNINADKFKIPGFKGTLKYDGFYAESFKPMAGGIIGLSKIVTEKDFSAAKESVTNEALAKASDNLKSKVNGLKIAEQVVEITELKSTAETDDAVDGFAVAATAEAKTIAFQEEDLFKLIEVFVSKEDGLILLKETLDLKFEEPKLDFEKKLLSFKLSVKGEAALKVDQQKMINSLLGMKQGKIKDYLLTIPEVESARVILSPFWVRSMPKKLENVKIEVLY